MEDQVERLSRAVGRLWSGLPLVGVVVAPAVASWIGLMAAGRDWFGLTGWWAVLVPLSLDALAFHFARLSKRAVLAGDSALADRVLVWVYVLASAALNWTHGQVLYGAAGALFFSAASVSAVVAWDRALRSYRRDALRKVGAIEAPLPRFRALRWLVAPEETARAWRIAVTEGVSSPAQALALARRPADEPITISLPRGKATAELSQDCEVWAYDPNVVDERNVAAELSACESKSAALHVAWRVLGVDGVPATSDVMPAVAWLAERGVRVDKSRAYGVRREMEQSRRAALARSERLALVGGEK